jgi:hypothetical protein
MALIELEKRATIAGREPLYDTLEVSIERDVIDNRSLMDAGASSEQYVTINLNAECVLTGPTTETGATS